MTLAGMCQGQSGILVMRTWTPKNVLEELPVEAPRFISAGGYFAKEEIPGDAGVGSAKGRPERKISVRGGNLGFALGMGSKPSRCNFLRASFLTRRTDSAFSRTRRSDGFS